MCMFPVIASVTHVGMCCTTSLRLKSFAALPFRDMLERPCQESAIGPCICTLYRHVCNPEGDGLGVVRTTYYFV